MEAPHRTGRKLCVQNTNFNAKVLEYIGLFLSAAGNILELLPKYIPANGLYCESERKSESSSIFFQCYKSCETNFTWNDKLDDLGVDDISLLLNEALPFSASLSSGFHPTYSRPQTGQITSVPTRKSTALQYAGAKRCKLDWGYSGGIYRELFLSVSLRLFPSTSPCPREPSKSSSLLSPSTRFMQHYISPLFFPDLSEILLPLSITWSQLSQGLNIHWSHLGLG